MSNERIDLTQFEGHTSDWSIQEGSVPTLFITDNDGVIATMEMDAEERYVADSLLISKAPDLLAELKRCYEELDWRHKVISALIEANTVKGEILDRLRTCDECGEPWDNHNSGADCEVDRQPASE